MPQDPKTASAAPASPKTWFITGATRGLGTEFARAALRAGERVVATGRKRGPLTADIGRDSDRLMSLEMDVTDAAQVRSAVAAAHARFGSIDVLVNNAGYGQYGFFEESTLEEARAQFETNLYGVLNVTWAVLPHMRAARKGRIFNISSLGGLMGGSTASLYCATKFALEGFSEALAKEVAPFGLFVTIVEPGPFRTEFLTPASLHLASKRIPDYDDRRAEALAGIEQRNGKQPGDPVKLAEALVQLAADTKPPMRFLAGAIAVDTADNKLAAMRVELDHWRQLSIGTDGSFPDVNTAALRNLLKPA
jgi:NAD(P)-dependent dehydrogenase (short-subunit alcohol dehydrogenase family)